MCSRLLLAAVAGFSLSLPSQGRAQGAFPIRFGVSELPLSEPFFFVRDDPATGEELWVTDGTRSGTFLLRDVNPGLNPDAPAPRPLARTGVPDSRWFTASVVGGRVVFAEFEPVTGYEVWATDGTPIGTVQLADASPGPASGLPNAGSGETGRIGPNQLVYTATNPTVGSELWTTDGTPAGTMLLLDIRPGADGSNPRGYDDVPGKILFSANDGSGEAVWVTDGTPGGTIPLGVGGRLRRAGAALGTGMFWVEDDEDNDRALWTTDGTPGGTSLVTTYNTGQSFGFPEDFPLGVEVGGKMIFRVESADGFEPWVTDGTPLGTTLLKDLNPGAASSNPVGFFLAGGKVFFRATTEAAGSELWITDGTPGGTIVVDIVPGADSSSPAGFVNVNGTLLFRVDGDLWTSDGTVAGTTLFFDLPISMASIGRFVQVGGLWYFNVRPPLNIFNNSDFAFDLWRTDGTPAGTRLVAHDPPARLDELAIVGKAGGVLFMGNPSVQYWVLDPSVGACPPAPSAGCFAAGSAMLTLLEERIAGETLSLIMKGFVPAASAADFGDPVSGSTRWDVCVYDQSGTLVTDLIVDRDQGQCSFGKKDKACWSASSSGLKYKDKWLGSYGVEKIIAKAAGGASSSIVLKAKNKFSTQVALPLSAAALAGDTSATVQVLTNDAACFEAVLDQVTIANGARFSGRRY